jgi:hypothetical protein
LNCRPVDCDLARELGFDDQRLVVGFFDGAGESISIFQGDLIGEERRASYDDEETDSNFCDAHSRSSTVKRMGLFTIQGK